MVGLVLLAAFGVMGVIAVAYGWMASRRADREALAYAGAGEDPGASAAAAAPAEPTVRFEARRVFVPARRSGDAGSLAPGADAGDPARAAQSARPASPGDTGARSAEGRLGTSPLSDGAPAAPGPAPQRPAPGASAPGRSGSERDPLEVSPQSAPMAGPPATDPGAASPSFTSATDRDRTALGAEAVASIEEAYGRGLGSIDTEAGRATLEQLIHDWPTSNRAACATLALASELARDGQEDRARELLRGLAEGDSQASLRNGEIVRARALLAYGDMLSEAGEREAARAAWQQVIDEFGQAHDPSGESYADIARRRLDEPP